jgi:WD40 repeat protein
MRTYSAPSGVGGITWLGDERLLAVGLKKAVGLMDTATGKVTTVLRDLDSRVYCMEYDHVHNRLLVGTWGGEIRVWNCDDILDGR